MIVWLASYPRSGNTFFRVILNSVFDIKTYSIYDDKGDIGADEKTSKVVGHEFLPENFDIQKARDEENTYYIKTHELLDNRVDDNDKVIYLIRDGRESTLSFTKHINTFSNQNPQLIDTIYGNTFIGNWGGHVKSWDPKNRNNTLLIKFETLIKEPIKYIEILSKFLQIKPTGDKIPTFEELKKINPKFFRSGKTNSWEEVYSEDEHISFWFKNSQIMFDYGYEYNKPTILNDIQDNKFLMESIHQNNYLMDLIFTENKKSDILNNKVETLNNKVETSSNKLDNLNNKFDMLNKELEEKNNALSEKQKLIEQKNQELLEIKPSRPYKFVNILFKPYKSLKNLLNKDK